jgi:hypothetical protein
MLLSSDRRGAPAKVGKAIRLCFQNAIPALSIHVLFAVFAMKTITDNQRNGELGETLVKAAVLRLGHVFEGRGRLETGVDGTIEFRDPATGKMLGKTVAVQVKTMAGATYSREDGTGFDYLLRSADLEYWRNTNLPVVIIVVRLSGAAFGPP